MPDGSQKYNFHVKVSDRGFNDNDVTNKVRVWTFCGAITLRVSFLSLPHVCPEPVLANHFVLNDAETHQQKRDVYI